MKQAGDRGGDAICMGEPVGQATASATV
jgi:hypothetical protein